MKNCRVGSQPWYLGLVVALPIVLSGCDYRFPWEPEPKKEVKVSYAAKAEENARKGLDYFIVSVRKKDADRYFALITITGPNGESEKLWVENVYRLSPRTMSGHVQTPPKKLGRGLQGAKVTFASKQIVDWMLVRNGQEIGGFSEIRPILN